MLIYVCIAPTISIQLGSVMLIIYVRVLYPSCTIVVEHLINSIHAPLRSMPL